MRHTNSNTEVEELEHQLEQSLRRVEPDPEFVHHLHDRLTTPSGMSIERRQSLVFGLLMTALSLTTGLVLVWIMRQFRTA